MKKQEKNSLMANILTKENFDSVISSSKPVIVDFYADWCGPCRMLAPTIEALASEREDIVVAKVNVDNSPELAVRFGVSSIPTVLAFRGGELLGRSVGVKSKDQLLDLIK